MDAISDGVVIYRHDGRIEQENAAARLLGYQLSDRDLPMAERRARLRAELVNNPTSGVEQMPAARALRGETVRGELMRFCPTDGSDSAARYVLVSAAPICDRSGVSLGAVASLSDVTELRRARDELEQRVQERTAELEAIFASVPDALYVANEKGIVRGNQAALDAFGANSVDELGEIGAAAWREDAGALCGHGRTDTATRPGHCSRTPRRTGRARGGQPQSAKPGKTRFTASRPRPSS